MSSKLFLLSLALAVYCVAISPNVQAEVYPGLRFGGYSDPSGAFIGGELLMETGVRDWFFNPNVEYVFGDVSRVATFNFDFHYDFPTRSNYYFWMGAGPAIIYTDWDNRFRGNETDLGANILMGVGFNKGGKVTPYVQPKVIISDRSEFAIAFGLRFH